MRRKKFLIISGIVMIVVGLTTFLLLNYDWIFKKSNTNDNKQNKENNTTKKENLESVYVSSYEITKTLNSSDVTVKIDYYYEVDDNCLEGVYSISINGKTFNDSLDYFDNFSYTKLWCQGDKSVEEQLNEYKNDISKINKAIEDNIEIINSDKEYLALLLFDRYYADNSTGVALIIINDEGTAIGQALVKPGFSTISALENCNVNYNNIKLFDKNEFFYLVENNTIYYLDIDAKEHKVTVEKNIVNNEVTHICTANVSGK